MKKLLLSFVFLVGLNISMSSQCSTSSAPTNNCASYGDQIDTFTLAGVGSPGSPGCSANGYGFFNSPVWNLQIGSTYTFAANVGGGVYSEGFSIWIDYNNDGFYAAGEQLYAGAQAASHSSTIAIPYSAVIANGIKMRIMCAYGSISGSDACTSGLNTWGETEDYLVNITCPAGAATLSVAATSTYVCAGTSVTLTANGASSYTWTGGITNGVGFSPLATTVYTVTGGIAGCPSSTATAVKTISVTNIPLPVVALSSPVSVCAGLTATLSAGGANNYTWMPVNLTNANPIVSPLVTTIYTLTGSNGPGTGCSGTATVALTIKQNPTVTTTGSSFSICAGETVTLSAFGATSYSWQTGSTNSSITLSPSSATAITVYGTNTLGCTTSTSQVVVVQPSPVVSLIATNTLICLGGSVSITASSSSNNYLWNFGSTNATEVVTPATNTTYSVTSTLNGCSTTESITISVFTQTLSVSASTAICKGATITLNASGGTTYQWSDGQSGSTVSVSPTTNTVYVVSATTQTNNMTCASSGTVNVTVNPNPTVTAVLTKTLICKGETTTITANGATNYAWNTGATTASFSVSPTINTNYTVTGTDANNCSNTATVQLRVQTCAGIAQVNGLENYELSIYPNPSNGAFTIKSDVAINLSLINELGQTVKTISLTEANKHEVNISELANGIYFVVGKTDSIKVNQKIVVAK